MSRGAFCAAPRRLFIDVYAFAGVAAAFAATERRQFD